MVPTPVGNMSDMTPRAVEVLKECCVILAEDTRTSSVLLKHFGITTPLIAHHMHNEHATVSGIADRIESGESVALVTDAGTPGISDPGFLLSRECRNRGIEVITLPGPTAFVPALVNSGLPCDRFLFEGFLPQKKGRATRIAELAELPYTLIIYESPLRLAKTLGQLGESFGKDRKASVSREISKIHETTVKGTLGELEDYFVRNIPKGEIVIVIEGKQQEAGRVHINKYKNNKTDS